MNAQEVPHLDLERWRHALPQLLDRPGQRLARGGEEPVHLLGGEGGALAEGRQAGGPQDLVAVAVADARDEGLVAKQVLQLTAMPCDPPRQVARSSAGSSASGPCSDQPATGRAVPAGST